MNNASKALLAAMLLIASASAAAASLCNRATDPCALVPTWGVVDPDGKPAELKASAAAVRRIEPPKLEGLLAAIKTATYDRTGNLIGGKEAIRSAVEDLRKSEPKKPLTLKLSKPAALGYNDSRAFDARVRSLNGVLGAASPDAPIIVTSGGR